MGKKKVVKVKEGKLPTSEFQSGIPVLNKTATELSMMAREKSADDPWKNRSANISCRTCMWFVEKVSSKFSISQRIGRCRRHAPTMSGYPVVYPHDWCGDHNLDENKA